MTAEETEMIANIIDMRKRPYRFKKINAIIEPTWHDNPCLDADQIARVSGDNDGIGYDEKEHVSIAEAVAWATADPGLVTLYLYDHDAGLYPYDSIDVDAVIDAA